MSFAATLPQLPLPTTVTLDLWTCPSSEKLVSDAVSTSKAGAMEIEMWAHRMIMMMEDEEEKEGNIKRKEEERGRRRRTRIDRNDVTCQTRAIGSMRLSKSRNPYSPLLPFPSSSICLYAYLFPFFQILLSNSFRIERDIHSSDYSRWLYV